MTQNQLQDFCSPGNTWKRVLCNSSHYAVTEWLVSSQHLFLWSSLYGSERICYQGLGVWPSSLCRAPVLVLLIQSLTLMFRSEKALRYLRCYLGRTKHKECTQPLCGIKCLHFCLAIKVLLKFIFRAATISDQCKISLISLWDPSGISLPKTLSSQV